MNLVERAMLTDRRVEGMDVNEETHNWSAATWSQARRPASDCRTCGSSLPQTVPMHRFTSLYLGGMTLFFFLCEVCTGVMLMLYYRPSAEEAFESIEFLVTRPSVRMVLRSITLSAEPDGVLRAHHMVSVYFLKAYRPPRELTW